MRARDRAGGGDTWFLSLVPLARGGTRCGKPKGGMFCSGWSVKVLGYELVHEWDSIGEEAALADTSERFDLWLLG